MNSQEENILTSGVLIKYLLLGLMIIKLC